MPIGDLIDDLWGKREKGDGVQGNGAGELDQPGKGKIEGGRPLSTSTSPACAACLDSRTRYRSVTAV